MHRRQAGCCAKLRDSHGATPRQVALRFLLRQPEVFVIPKASEISHVEENAATYDVDIDDSDIAEIDAAFPLGKASRGLPMI